MVLCRNTKGKLLLNNNNMLKISNFAKRYFVIFTQNITWPDSWICFATVYNKRTSVNNIYKFLSNLKEEHANLHTHRETFGNIS